MMIVRPKDQWTSADRQGRQQVFRFWLGATLAICMLLYLQPWESHLLSSTINAVCSSISIATIFDIIVTCYHSSVVLLTIAFFYHLNHMDEGAFTGNLCKAEKPPFVYPRWLLILSNLMMSNQTWTLWMLLLGLIPQRVGASPYQSKSCCWTFRTPIETSGHPTTTWTYCLCAHFSHNTSRNNRLTPCI
jgi:hypothetical protein